MLILMKYVGGGVKKGEDVNKVLKEEMKESKRRRPLSVQYLFIKFCSFNIKRRPPNRRLFAVRADCIM